MHYEAITRKQRYCQNVQAIGSKKTSECDVLHFACSELHPSWIVHWLLHGLESSLFFSGQSNKKIKNTKHNIYMLLISTEKRIYVASRRHLTSVFSAVGMLSTTDD